MQNKIYGRQFCVVGVTEQMFNNKPKFAVSQPGILYRVNQETLADWEIKDDFVDDILDQLNKLGTIKEIRGKLGIEPFGGYRETGITLKHSKNPKVLVHVRVSSGPLNFENPNSYAYPVDMFLYCYYDVDDVAETDDRDDEQEMKLMKALSHSRMGVSDELMWPEEEFKYEEKERVEVVDPLVETSDFYEDLSK